MENIELFDDLIEITQAFPVSDEEARLREADKKPVKDEIKTNTLEIKLPEEEVEDDEEEEIDEKSIEKEDEVDDEVDDEISEEEKQVVEQVTALKNLGALLLPDDYEAESVEKALEDSNNYRNQLAVNTIFNSIPDVEVPGLGNAKDLFVYMYEHGGTDLDKFKQTFGNESFNPNNFDLQEEDDRRKVLETYYSKKGFNEIKTKKLVDKIFDDLEDESEATEALGELVKIDAQSKQAHLQELEVKKQERIKEAQIAYQHQVDILNGKDLVGGYPMGKEEKPKALNSLYSKVNVGGKEMSDFDYRLQGVVLRNPELTLALSAFLNTLSQDNKGNVYFDLSKFERKEKTKAVKSLREEVSRATSGTRRKMTSSSSGENPNNKGFKWDSVVDYNELM